MLTLTGLDDIGGGTTISAGTLVLGNGGSLGGGVTFAGTATLQFNSGTNQLAGNIAGGAAGDAIDLRFQSFAAGDKVVWQQNGMSGVLTLETAGGTALATLALTGQYASANFSLACDRRPWRHDDQLAKPATAIRRLLPT